MNEMSTDRSSPGYIPNTPLSRAINGSFPTGTRQTNTSLYPGMKKESFTVSNPTNIITAIIIVVVIVLIILCIVYIFKCNKKCKNTSRNNEFTSIRYPETVFGGEELDDMEDYYDSDYEFDEYIEGGAAKKKAAKKAVKKTAKKAAKKAVKKASGPKKTEAEKIVNQKEKISKMKDKIKELNKNPTPANKKKIMELTKKIAVAEKKLKELKNKKSKKAIDFII